MVVCKYYLEGRCSFGDRCKNEHPQSGSSGGFGFVDRSGHPSIQNRLGFAARNSQPLYEDKTIRLDLTRDRPIWPFSVYGPAKEEPNLIEGTDFSPEELRVEYYLRRGGNEYQYQNEVNRMEHSMNDKIQTTTKDLRNVLRNFENQKRQHSGFDNSGGFGNNSGLGLSSGFGNNTNALSNSSGFGSSDVGFGLNSGGFASNTGGFASSTGGFGNNTGGFASSTGGLGSNTGGFASNTGGFAGNTGGFASSAGGFGNNTGGFAGNAGAFASSTGGYNTGAFGSTGGFGTPQQQIPPNASGFLQQPSQLQQFQQPQQQLQFQVQQPQPQTQLQQPTNIFGNPQNEAGQSAPNTQNIPQMDGHASQPSFFEIYNVPDAPPPPYSSFHQ